MQIKIPSIDLSLDESFIFYLAIFLYLFIGVIVAKVLRRKFGFNDDYIPAIVMILGWPVVFLLGIFYIIDVIAEKITK